MKKIIFKTGLILAFFILSFNSKSQCDPVCVTNQPTVHIAGGTFTFVPSGTQSVAVVNQPTISAKGAYTVTTSYKYQSVSGVQTISAGALSVSVSNVGGASALFNAITLPAGATININIPNATLPAYTYDSLTSALMIVVNQ